MLENRRVWTITRTEGSALHANTVAICSSESALANDSPVKDICSYHREQGCE